MSSSPLKTYLVYSPDYPDALERRLKVRPEHIKRANERRQAGDTVVGGAILDDQGRMVGSMMICVAKDEKEVREVVESDAYYVGDVWDKSKIIIRPYRVNGVNTAKL